MQITIDFTGHDPEYISKVLKAIARATGPTQPRAVRGPALNSDRLQLRKWIDDRQGRFSYADMRSAFPRMPKTSLYTYMRDFKIEGTVQALSPGLFQRAV